MLRQRFSAAAHLSSSLRLEASTLLTNAQCGFPEDATDSALCGVYMCCVAGETREQHGRENMTNPLQHRMTDDWRIKIENIVEASFVISLGFQKWIFLSQRLGYACACFVPRAGAGLSIGVDIGASVPENVSSQIPNLSEEHFEILRPFNANCLDGAMFRSFAVGARGVVAGASGEQLRLRNRAGRDIVRFRGGEVSVGLGVEVNLGQINVGTLYGPYEMGVGEARRSLGMSNVRKARRPSELVCG